MPKYLHFLLLLLMPLTGWAQGPVANFTAQLTQGCSPLLVQFTNTSTGTVPGTTYQWNFSLSGTSSVLQNPATTFNTPGQYTVTLTVTNPGGASNTKTIPNMITVHPSPVPSWTVNDSTGCVPHAVTFTNTTNLQASGAGTYQWSFGDGSTSTQASPAHTYTASGSYTVSLQATNSFGCSNTTTRTAHITVANRPVAAFAANTTALCQPNTAVVFSGGATGTPGPYTYNWDFGDGGTATTSNPTHTYAGTGPYTVRLIVTDANGCSDTLLKPSYIQPLVIQASFSTASPVGCAGAPYGFYNTSSAAAGSLLWNFGPGANPQTATGTNPAPVFGAPGTYPVTLIASVGGCSDTFVQNVTIVASPVASFTTSNQAPCSAPATVNFTNTSTGAVSYTWLFGDGSSSTATNPTHTFTGYGSYSDTLIAVSAAGCSSQVVKPNDVVIRNLLSQVTATPYEGCVPLTVPFSVSLSSSLGAQGPYPFPITSWLWDFRDGTTSTLAAPSHTFTTQGTYWVTVTVTTANGCTKTDSIKIETGTKPVASFTLTPATTCVKQDVFFTATGTGATNYLWFFGDGGSSGGTNTTHRYTVPGTYSVTHVAINNGCYDTVIVPNAVVVHPPNAQFVAQYSCDTPGRVTFSNTSAGAQTYSWSFGDGTTSTALQPVKTYSGTGTYTVQLITANATYGCADTATGTVQIYPSVPSLVASDTLICTGDSIRISGSLSGLNATTWKWEYQDGSILWQTDTSTRAYMDHRYNTRGRYGVRLITSDEHGCFDTLTRAAYIAVARPVVGFSGTPLVGCIPLTVNFTDTSSNIFGVANSLRKWTFTPTATLNTTATAASFTYTSRGSYDVKLEVTDVAGCIDSLRKTGYIRALKPTASITAFNTTVCTGSPVTLYGSGSTGVAPLTYNWDFGDGTTSSQVSPIHTYAANGTYNVRLIVTDSAGCRDTLLKPGYITVGGPTAAFTASDTQSVCAPLLVNFVNNSSPGATLAWNFGNTTGSTLSNPSTTYTSPGVYTARLIATDANGCSDTAEKAIRVLGYAGAFSYTPLSGCSPLAVQFSTTLTNVPSLIWDFSDGVTAPGTGTTVTHVYQTPGAYVPKIILSNGAACVAGSTGLDTIKVDGVRAGFSHTPACEGTDIRFTDTSKGVFSAVTRREWIFPGNLRFTTVNPVFRPTGNSPFTVTLIVINAAGCTDTLTRTITLSPPPVVTASPDTVVCLNDAVVISASGAVSYSWSPAATLTNANTATPEARPNSRTSYVVTGTDANGCTDTDTVIVNVKTKTTAFAGKDTAICQGQNAQLLAWGADTYQWTPATGLNNASAAQPLAAPEATTTYLVIAREGSCQPDTHRVVVTVYPKPEVNAGADATVVAGTPHTLIATGSNIDNFLWSPAEGVSCSTCATTQAQPFQRTQYTVLATSRQGCSDTDAVVIDVRCDGSQFFIPNTFTPNGDGENDFFFPHATGVETIKSFRVYNRWGEVVFQKENFAPNDRTAGWDGTFKGERLAPDTFVYTLEADCQNGDPLVKKGDVTLLR